MPASSWIAPFEQLDYLYTPSVDVAADVEQLTTQLGAQLVFAIEAFGARVALLRFSGGPPDVLLADHLTGERPVLVYSVSSLDDAIGQLRERSCDAGPRFGIPPGPCCEVTTPGGHRFAIYERTRPGVIDSMTGRRDF